MKPQEYFAVWLRLRRAPDWKAEISKIRRRYVIMVIGMGAFSGAFATFFPELAALIIGIGVGGLIGAIAALENRIRGLQKNWPILEEVVDWTRLEQRVRENA